MNPDYGVNYEKLYQAHWWWRVRERILLRVIAGLDLPGDARILDVGCGNGLFLQQLRHYGEVRGIEVDASLLSDANPLRDSISTQPLGSPCYEGCRFDLITACDVIEHIEDDRGAVRAMCDMLQPGGYLLLTVPAWMLLWDEHDELNHHYRRYAKRDVSELLGGALQIRECRYLFTSLFLPKLAVKWWNRWGPTRVAQHRACPLWLNQVMQYACYAEHLAFERLPLPLGTSVLAVGRKVCQAERVPSLRDETSSQQLAHAVLQAKVPRALALPALPLRGPLKRFAYF